MSNDISSIKPMTAFFLRSYGADNFRLGMLPLKQIDTNIGSPRACVCACVCLRIRKSLCFRTAVHKNLLGKRKGEGFSESSLLLSRKWPTKLFKTICYPETACREFQKHQGILKDPLPWRSVEFLLKNSSACFQASLKSAIWVQEYHRNVLSSM